MTREVPADEELHDRAGIHHHPHEHEDALPHRHPHHHRDTRGPDHDHHHARSFEQLTRICSPVHSLDPRAKILCVGLLVLAIVLAPPPGLLEFALLVALFAATTLIARLPLGRVAARTALVLPFAGTIALFAPLQGDAGSLNPAGLAAAYAGDGWVAAWAVVAKAWLSVSWLVLLAATTPPDRLFKGLAALRMPDVILMLLTFIYRYAEALKAQVLSVRRALASRGPSVRGWRLVTLYGHLAGNLFVRSYERGERVWAAMVSRGYGGALPSPEPLTFSAPDALTLSLAIMTAAALALY